VTHFWTNFEQVFYMVFYERNHELCEDLAFIFCKVSVMKSAAFVKEEEHADK